ncbi:DNA polymerase iota [Sitodiplosis mosellana]|uniref:DNA polymerase iota n=1 Tax=Sitodiplosis mosellana TaxID=263140 RepID=UPI00244478A0|nr:DNA polymerase iota [Sitodiplosis mosellana]XP_055322919.1 DNA polymerase iota [Sitodiplosis mosellana]
MDENESTFGLSEEQHTNVIIHIDIDCFYAQVEEIRDPTLRNRPLGIQQKNIVVTCNYVARTYGVKKLMLLTDALRLCPDLILVKGEDLTPYRQMSNKIHSVLLTFTPLVEKLGMDENFLDVTNIVNARISSECDRNIDENMLPDCHVFPEYETLASCGCGCEKRLTIGVRLARDIRQKLFSELQITSCAGIAHNKILAKIVGAKNKPNKQTVLIPSCTTDVMIGLDTIRSIPGIGQKAEQLLNEYGVRTVKELQDMDFTVLQKIFGFETAVKYRNWSLGIDKSAVIASGKSKTLSIEDSCRSISIRADVEDKFRLLLIRLVNQVAEDGRIPLVVKITVRKYDAIKKTSHRETKQANILPSLFKDTGNGRIVLVENGQEKLLKIVMRLFERVVNLKLPFNITLLGLSFSKFQERTHVSRSIANFLIRTADLEVQSITSLSSDGLQSIKNYQLRSSPTQMDFDTISEASHASYSSDISESEIEPSPKKNKFSLSLAKRRCFATNSTAETASPSKLRVADLRLNSSDSDVNMHSPHDFKATFAEHVVPCIVPPSNRNTTHEMVNAQSTPSKMTIGAAAATTTTATATATATATTNSNSTNFPPIVDPEVFKELPFEVQEELLNQWRTSHETTTTTTTTESHANVVLKTRPGSKKSKSNTLHRYFITNN